MLRVESGGRKLNPRAEWSIVYTVKAFLSWAGGSLFVKGVLKKALPRAVNLGGPSSVISFQVLNLPPLFTKDPSAARLVLFFGKGVKHDELNIHGGSGPGHL